MEPHSAREDARSLRPPAPLAPQRAVCHATCHHLLHSETRRQRDAIGRPHPSRGAVSCTAKRDANEIQPDSFSLLCRNLIHSDTRRRRDASAPARSGLAMKPNHTPPTAPPAQSRPARSSLPAATSTSTRQGRSSRSRCNLGGPDLDVAGGPVLDAGCQLRESQNPCTRKRPRQPLFRGVWRQDHSPESAPRPVVREMRQEEPDAPEQPWRAAPGAPAASAPVATDGAATKPHAPDRVRPAPLSAADPVRRVTTKAHAPEQTCGAGGRAGLGAGLIAAKPHAPQTGPPGAGWSSGLSARSRFRHLLLAGTAAPGFRHVAASLTAGTRRS